MVFPDGFLDGLLQHILLIPHFSSFYNGLLLMGFLFTSLVSAWLAHSLIRGRKSELGPHLILFFLATSIIPTLLMALLFWPDGRGKLSLEMGFFASLFIAIFFACLRFILTHGENPAQDEPINKVDGKIGWAWAFLLPVIVIFSLAYIRGPLSIVGFDALAYHLPLVASWVNNASITRGFDIQYDYPGNSELVIRWGFVGGSENFAFLVPFFIAILCIYMIYKLGRAIGQGKEPALVAACCIVTVPIIPFLATTVYTDIMGVLFLLLSVFFLIRWMQCNLEVISHLLCAGLAAGLAVGTKLSMLPPVLAIVIAAIIGTLRSQHIWRSTGTRPEDVGLNWSWLFTRAGAFCLAALLGGGYWYLRNWLEYGNPFHPISVLGLPGLDMNVIVPKYTVFTLSPWKQILYPWTEVTYSSTFDDGTGAVVAGIVIPSFLIFPFLPKRTEVVKLTGPGVIYLIAWVSLLYIALSGNMIMRYGLFAIIICFIFIGEVWERMHSIRFKALTLAAFLIMSVALIYNFAGGSLYEYLRSNETRAERLSVPEVVDSLPGTRIFNGAGSFHTYGLMGQDYRHEVVTLFKEAKPEDVLAFRPTHILLKKNQEETFKAKLSLTRIGTETKGVDPVSLWEIVQSPQNAP